MNTRLLTIADLEQFWTLIDRKYHAKELKSVSANERFIETLKRSKENSNIRVYGTFNQDDELLSAICQHMWLRFPGYALLWMLVHPKYLHSKFSKSISEAGLRYSLDAALEYGESINRWQFFYGVTVKNFSSRRQIFLEEKNTKLYRDYDSYVETVIKAGTIPEFEPWKYLIGNTARKEDIIIKSCRLKNALILNRLSEQQLVSDTIISEYVK